ncbi:MAG: ApbE family lipoprotein [Pedosphaera sp.]|nr:ApbE family lipoprotein [Pedosphaera sp.]
MVLTENPVINRIRASLREQTRANIHEVTFHAMGTPCRMLFRATPQLASAFSSEALCWVADFEARYSRFLPDSLISRINAAAGQHWVETDPETDRLLALCHELNFITQGVFDPTSLPLIRLWDWKANPPRIPEDEAIAATLRLVGWRKLQRAPGKVFLPEPGMALDFGGVGKEYAVDQVSALAVARGIADVLVDFGADVRVQGTPPEGRGAWHIGLQDPKQPSRCWGSVAVQNAAVATSGDYLRCFTANGRRYGHILDVRTGRPVENGCLAVSIISPSCTRAGMLATTAFVLGPQAGLHLIDSTFQAEGCIITEQNRLTSKRFYDHFVS